jgi:hypothetical protein
MYQFLSASIPGIDLCITTIHANSARTTNASNNTNNYKYMFVDGSFQGR